MKNVREGNGITLIALVITVIVLLILSGVTIVALSGDNGILQRAVEAEEQTEKAEKEEKEKLGDMEDAINEYSTGITVEQVTDENPGVLEGTGTDDDPYTINSIEDLVFFAHDVTNGNNYEGKYVNLGLSLDFNSTKSYVDAYRTDYKTYGYDGELKTMLTSGEGFKTIGITTEDNKEKNLLGTFDGKGNTIYNLYINVSNRGKGIEFEKRGLFANNYGTICNLKLLNVNLYLNTDNGRLAGVCAQNFSTGNINNCIVSGNIKDESFQGTAGGITCWSSGNINNCGNDANIFCKITQSPETSIGGICTGKSSSSEVRNCYNRGTIEGVCDSGPLYIGGICGNIEGRIENCYNTGDIIGKARDRLRIGGIAGTVGNTTIMNNCYSTAENIIENGGTTTEKGMILGKNISEAISNLYYKKIDETPGIGAANIDENLGDDTEMAKTGEQMKSREFLDLLNQNSENIWKEDTNNINNGYPILTWQ